MWFQWEALPEDARVAVLSRMPLHDLHSFAITGKESSRLLARSGLQHVPGAAAAGEWYVTVVGDTVSMFRKGDAAHTPLQAFGGERVRIVASFGSLVCLQRYNREKKLIVLLVVNPFVPRHCVRIPVPWLKYVAIKYEMSRGSDNAPGSFRLVILWNKPPELNPSCSIFDSRKRSWKHLQIELEPGEYFSITYGGSGSTLEGGNTLYLVTAREGGACATQTILMLRSFNIDTGCLSTVSSSLMRLCPTDKAELERTWNNLKFWMRTCAFMALGFRLDHCPVPLVCGGRLVLAAYEFRTMTHEDGDEFYDLGIKLMVHSPGDDTWKLLSRAPTELVTPTDVLDSPRDFQAAVVASSTRIVFSFASLHELPTIVYDMPTGEWCCVSEKHSERKETHAVEFSMDTKERRKRRRIYTKSMDRGHESGMRLN